MNQKSVISFISIYSSPLYYEYLHLLVTNISESHINSQLQLIISSSSYNSKTVNQDHHTLSPLSIYSDPQVIEYPSLNIYNYSVTPNQSSYLIQSRLLIHPTSIKLNRRSKIKVIIQLYKSRFHWSCPIQSILFSNLKSNSTLTSS